MVTSVSTPIIFAMYALRPWALTPQPLPDELLSSWLSRTSLKHAQSATSFWRAEHGSSLIKRDIDVYQPPGLVDFVHLKTKATHKQILSHTLNDFTRVFSTNPINGCSWVTRIGNGALSRQRHGLAYCPLCLTSEPVPYFKKNHRMAWVTTCVDHQCILQDECPHCRAPISPIWMPAYTERLGMCHACLRPLSDARPHCAEDSVINLQLTISSYLHPAPEDTRQLFVGERLLLDGLKTLFNLFMPTSPNRGIRVAKAESLSALERYSCIRNISIFLRENKKNIFDHPGLKRTPSKVLSDCSQHPLWAKLILENSCPPSPIISSEEILWADKYLVENGTRPTYKNRRLFWTQGLKTVRMSKAPSHKLKSNACLSEIEARLLLTRSNARSQKEINEALNNIYHHAWRIADVATHLKTSPTEAHRQLVFEINRCCPKPFVMPGELRRAGIRHRKNNSYANALAQTKRKFLKRFL